MKERLLAAGQRVWTEFRKFTPGQKLVAVAALAALVIGGYFMTTWKAAPTYAPLYTNLAPTDASAIIDKLNASGTSYQLGAGGTEILVPQSQVYTTRIAMSSAGLPGSSNTGYSLLDKEGVTTSQFQQQIDYQRAMEGELEKTIDAIGGVQGSSVHLGIPQQDVFSDNTNKPTAAVLITTSASNVLTTSQVQSIVYLVSSSVPGMTADGVTVSDSNGNVLKAPGGSGASGLADASSQNQQTQSYDNQLQSALQAKLDSIVGPGHSNVTVNAQLNFDQTVTTTNKYLQSNLPPLSQTTSKQTYTGSGASPTGTLGSTGTTGSGSKSGKYSQTSTTVNNALGTQRQRVTTAVGQLKNLSIAVALDSNVKNLNVGAITSLVKSAAGYNAARGDSLAVQSLPFSKTGQLAPGATATTASSGPSPLMGYIKQGVLALLVIGVLVGAFVASKRKARTAPPANDDVLPFPEDEYDAEEAEARAANVTQLRAVAERRRALAAAVDDRPQDVARVLSSWLNTKETGS